MPVRHTGDISSTLIIRSKIRVVCKMSLTKDMSGVKFGILTVIERSGSKGHRALWLCKCDCGKETTVRGKYLRSGHTKSCGCLRKNFKHYIHGQTGTPEFKMLCRARRRAKIDNLEFNLELSDIIIPEFCPLLKCKLNTNYTNQCPTSPALDRINNNLGYIKGNVWVISHRANTVKSNCALDELRSIVKGLENKLIEGLNA